MIVTTTNALRFPQISVNVQANMIEPNNGQALSPTQDNRPRYTGELLLRTRPKTYYKVVRMLAEGSSVNSVTRECRVSEHTVNAIAERRAEDIAERKKSIIANLGDVAELGSERMAEKIGKAGFRDTVIGTGVAVDKLLALTGQLSGPNIAVINMPSEQDREKTREIDSKLDAIFRLATRDGDAP
jgi:hypothetical protein